MKLSVKVYYFTLFFLLFLTGFTNLKSQTFSLERKTALLDSLSKNPSGMKYLFNDIEITEVEFYEKVYNGELDNLSNALMGTGKKAVLLFGEEFRDGVIIYESKEYENNKFDDRVEYIGDNQFVLNGVISNRFNGHKIMLFAFDENNLLNVDTAVVNNGKFKIIGTESLKDIGILSVGNYPDTVASQVLFLDKGNITVDMNRGRVGGSTYNDMYQEYLDTLNKLDLDLFELKSDEDGRKENEEGLFVIHGSPRHKKLIEIGKYTVGFKKHNINNIVGQYLFEEYTLIDFWASWCGPCIASFPHLKNLYSSYDREKIEIIGISIDTDNKAWNNAIEKEQLPWVQLITESSEVTQKLMDAYSFVGIPNYVLLNRKGEIISTGKSVNHLLNMIE